MDGWNTILSYWVSAYFQGRAVSFRKGISKTSFFSQFCCPLLAWCVGSELLIHYHDRYDEDFFFHPNDWVAGKDPTHGDDQRCPGIITNAGA